jgi:hypothetical protein
MTTYRERRERKADRLREWADKREERGTASYTEGREALHRIPFGQPILVGHHSERADRSYRNRATGKMERGFADLDKAKSMRSRADNIESQLDESIYSDDEDAIERLEERIASRTAYRDELKAENAAFRKEHRAELKAMSRYDAHQALPHPSWKITNLTADIGRQRKRVEHLRREAAAREAPVVSAIEGDGITVTTTERRVEVRFPAKPDYEVRQGLKAHGFRWDRVEYAWVVPVSYARGVEYAASLVSEEAA